MKDHEFDALLHEALREYRDAEPVSGVENRILRRLAEQHAGYRMHWLKWVAVATSATAMAACVWIATRHRGVTPESRPVQAVLGPVMPIEPHTILQRGRKPVKVLGSRPAQTHAVAHVAQTERPSPSEQFPTPVPLTESERAFLAASADQTAALRNQPDPDKPLSIAAIAIKPLAKSNQLSGENQ